MTLSKNWKEKKIISAVKLALEEITENTPKPAYSSSGPTGVNMEGEVSKAVVAEDRFAGLVPQGQLTGDKVSGRLHLYR